MGDNQEPARPWGEHWEDGASREHQGMVEDEQKHAREREAL